MRGSGLAFKGWNSRPEWKKERPPKRALQCSHVETLVRRLVPPCWHPGNFLQFFDWARALVPQSHQDCRRNVLKVGTGTHQLCHDLSLLVAVIGHLTDERDPHV